ncbi:MAG TPA: ABC transporter ATP-binding protein [Phycisphaerae bacterium]|nr:ABC transporter ATP-binding protein [Phycisphaerae bacterium]
MTKSTRTSQEIERQTPRLEVSDLHVSFASRSHRRLQRNKPRVHAVRGVDLSLQPGACMGLVGESGCGKSTLARAVMNLIPLDRGTIAVDGNDMHRVESKASRQRIQMIFQHAHASMNPRMTVESVVTDPLRFDDRCTKSERSRRVESALQLAGFDAPLRGRYPHELSGGQLQRVAIARALVLEPDVLICDEPVSALDVSAQVEILAQLKDIQQTRSLTMLFITHDLDIAAAICDRLAVMYLGRIVESGPTHEILRNPQHPYTHYLSAARDLKRTSALQPLMGEPPSPLAPPTGCSFHPRCPIKSDICHSQTPVLLSTSQSSLQHQAACLHSERMDELKEITTNR